MTREMIRPLTIGSLKTKNNVFLAPMAGATDAAFRAICREMGAGLTCTELATARGIRFHGSVEKHYKNLRIADGEHPVAIQLFGSDPRDFEEALDILFHHPVLSECDLIDINMGCPVPKVMKTGAGCALMGQPDLAAEIIRVAVRHSPVPVSVKIRKGLSEAAADPAEFAKRCEGAGAALITVHGRTAGQMYAGKADWSCIRDVSRAVSVPVVGNGDVDGAESAARMMSTTGADGVMIGRACLGNPWVFAEVIHAFDTQTGSGQKIRTSPPSMKDRVKMMKRHLADVLSYTPEDTAIREMRKHFIWYLKGTAHSAPIRKLFAECKSEREAQELFRLLESADIPEPGANPTVEFIRT